MSLVARFDELIGRPVSMRAMALLRVLVGLVVLEYLRPLVHDASRGTFYRDVFYEPYASWYPEPSRGLYAVLVWVAVIAAAAMVLGVFARVATSVVFAFVTYDFFLTTTNFHHNRAYLVIVLAALAVTPCGRELSVDAALRRRRGLPPLDTRSPGWPLWLLRFEASTVYFASGFSKLIDPDWFGGTVTRLRVLEHVTDLRANHVPGWMIDVLTSRGFHVAGAKVVVLTELFIALGLWSRRTRYAAVWVAMCFHLAIQLSAEVETFSFLALSVLSIWAVPSTGDRVLRVDPSRHAVFAAAVPWLDWLHRFRLERGPGPVTVVDRGGSTREGAAAVVFALGRFPLTAWFGLPLSLLWGRRTGSPAAEPVAAAAT